MNLTFLGVIMYTAVTLHCLKLPFLRFLLTIISKAKRILSSKIQYINVKKLESKEKSAKLHLVLGVMLLSLDEL